MPTNETTNNSEETISKQKVANAAATTTTDCCNNTSPPTTSAGNKIIMRQQDSENTVSGTNTATATASGATGNQAPRAQAEEPEKSRSGRSSLSSSSNGGAGGSGSGDEARLLSSNADYDHIRNTTLMFFLDRLYIASKDGKEARTLHDLSCLFGTREFTKEMRQIVGASRNGLKKFLQCYPSLFTIDGDKVYLTQLKQDAVAPVRDYNKEAVEYFIEKLLQFGTSLVPIRNLFGYRSQASQEVRHVSGKSVKEFKQFLSAHSSVFEILTDEHVILKSVLKELESRGETYSSLQQTYTIQPDEETVIDPYLNKQFAHYIENCMKNIEPEEGEEEGEDEKKAQTSSSSSTTISNNNDNNKVDGHIKTTTTIKVTIEYLHEKILNECNNQLFLKMVKTIEDLKMFLRMHPKIFKRFRCDQDPLKREFVSLLTDDERKEMETKSNSSSSYLLTRQHSTLRRTETNESNLSDNSSSSVGQPMSLPPQLNNNNNNNVKKYQPPKQRESSKPANNNAINHQDQPMSFIGGATKNKLSSMQTTNISNNNNNNNNVKQTSKPLTTTNSSSGSGHRATSNDNQTNTSSGHSSLRATAPPFVPSIHNNNNNNNNNNTRQVNKRLPLQASNSCQLLSPNNNQPTSGRAGYNQQQAGQMQRSLSNLASPSGGNHIQQHRAIKDPRAALRSYLIKATAVNSGNGLYSPNKLSNGAQHHQHHNHHQNNHQHQNHHHHHHNHSSSSVAQQAPLSRQSSNLTGSDDLRTRTVNIVREASNIVTRIMTSADAVAFDCKGYNLGFDGQITLVQFAFLPKSANNGPASCFDKENNNSINSSSSNNNNNKQKPEVCIFDLITNPELAYCLKPLLESDQIIKIVHDVKNKSNALYSQFEIMLNNVFDTQVANLVIQQQETGKPAYKSRYISMNKLCEIYGDESLSKYRNLIKSKTRHSTHTNNNNNNSSHNTTGNGNSKVKDVNYWRTRPLTDSMVYESTMDVYCLVGGIYQNLKSKIIPEYRPLFEQLNLEGVLARIKPDEIRSVKKERKIDLEVIDLKRKLYSDTTSSIVLSNREIRLLRHIDLSEEVRQKIQQCKKVAKKLERLDMKAAQLQSMTSQVNSSTNDQQQQNYMDGESIMASVNTTTTTNGSSLTSTGSSSSNHQSSSMLSNTNNDDRAATTNMDGQTSSGHLESLTKSLLDHQSDGSLFNERGELDETRVDNLMDGSMFDELKDKMIESSSLLESLANDVEEDDEVVSGEHLLHKHSGSHDDCRCLCHKGSSLILNEHSGENKSNSSLKLSLSSNEPNSIEQEQQEQEQEEKEEDPNESRAVDMAIQCDLLS